MNLVFFLLNPKILENYYLILTLTLTHHLSQNPYHKPQIKCVWKNLYHATVHKVAFFAFPILHTNLLMISVGYGKWKWLSIDL